MSRRRSEWRGSVYERKGRKGLWLKYEDVDGSWAYKKAAHATSRRKAQVELDKLEAKILAERAAGTGADLDDDVCLAVFLARHYIPLYTAEDLDEKTLARSRPAFKRAAEHFGLKPIGDISRTDARAYIVSLRKAGLAESSMRREVAALAPAFDEALECGLVDRNPFRGRGRNRIRIEPHRARKVVPVTDQQLEWICGEMPEKYHVFLEVLVLTGWRKEQVRTAVWSELSWTDDEQPDVLRGVKQKRGNSPMALCAGRLGKLLLALHDVRDETDDRIFPHIGKEGLKSAWRRAREAIAAGQDFDEIPKSDRARIATAQMADLRHTLVHRLKALGTPSRVLATLLGHRSERMAEDHYATLCSEDDVRAALERARRRGSTPTEDPEE